MMANTDGSCPQCSANGWVLNRVKGSLVDVCVGCGFTEPSEVKPRRNRRQRQEPIDWAEEALQRSGCCEISDEEEEFEFGGDRNG